MELEILLDEVDELALLELRLLDEWQTPLAGAVVSE